MRVVKQRPLEVNLINSGNNSTDEYLREVVHTNLAFEPWCLLREVSGTPTTRQNRTTFRIGLQYSKLVEACNELLLAQVVVGSGVYMFNMCTLTCIYVFIRDIIYIYMYTCVVIYIHTVYLYIHIYMYT